MAIRGKKISKQTIKRFLAGAVLLSGLIFPLACSDNNSNPTQPSAPGGGAAATSTPTGTLTPSTPTKTPTLGAGINTPTPTQTSSINFQSNFSTSASPRCMDLNGGNITVAESEVTVGGIVTEFESFTGAGTANLTLNSVGNVIGTGCPPIPPAPTPAVFIPTLKGLGQIQGYVNPGGYGGWAAVLDLAADGSGSATLYTGYANSWNDPPLGVFLDQGYMPFQATSYGGVPFNNPKGICSDSVGDLYLADTGLGYVDEITPYEGTCPLPALPLHRWNGFPGVTKGGTGSIFASPAVVFKSPCAVTCDTSLAPGGPHVWVGDSFYSNSYISEYTSGATTILQSWQGISGCKVQGIAVDTATGNVYVADGGNHLVEEYSPTGTLLNAFGDPGPAAHETYAFSPSCIAFSGGFIYVGDTANDYIDIFQ